MWHGHGHGHGGLHAAEEESSSSTKYEEDSLCSGPDSANEATDDAPDTAGANDPPRSFGPLYAGLEGGADSAEGGFVEFADESKPSVEQISAQLAR